MNEENLKNTSDASEVPEVSKGNEVSKGGSSNILMGLILTLLVVVTILSAAVIVLSCKNKKDITAVASAVEAVKADVAEVKGTTSETLSEMNEDLATVKDFADRMTTLLAGELGDDVAQEDDVTIGGEYVIKSTKEMTDAYKSGDTSALTDDQKACLELADSILKEIVTDDMTDYEKEVAVYEWMCANLKHDDGITVAIPTTGEYADNPYGVLSTKKAVCVGFATTFRMFMEMVDIECMVVHDSYLSHSWDEVKLDGDWYYVDVYMDVQTTSYANFNMNDELCEENHDWNQDFFPSATGTKYCYAVQNSEDFESYEQVAQEIRDILEAGKSSTLFIKVTGEEMYADYQLLEELAESIDDYILGSELSSSSYATWNVTKVDDETIIFIYTYENYDDDGDLEYTAGDIPDEKYEELEDAIDSVFGDFYDVHESTGYSYDDDSYYYNDYYENDTGSSFTYSVG